MLNKTPLSVVILTKNESANIKRCLTLVSWCDDVILVDDSKDETVEIAKSVLDKKQLRVIKNPQSENFAELRNSAFPLAIHDWLLFLDADEEITQQLKNEIIKNISSTNYLGFYLRRQDYFLGKWLNWGETRNIKHLKLGKKTVGRWRRRVHEVWEIKGRVGELNSPLLHYPHQTVAEFISHINRWTTLDAKEFFESGQRSSFWKIAFYPVGKFIGNYFLKLGILDGTPGLLMSMCMSFHSFLTRAKLFLLQTGS